MIYCVVPPELGEELYQKLVEYYKDNSNVEVIRERRTGSDRRQSSGSTPGGKRQVRDRRRPRVPGTFPSVEPPAPQPPA